MSQHSTFGNENLIHPRYEHLSNQLSTDFWELCEPIMPNPDEDSMIQLLTSQLGEIGIGDSPIFGFVEEPFNDTKPIGVRLAVKQATCSTFRISSKTLVIPQ